MTIENKIKNIISRIWSLPIESLHCSTCFPKDLAADSLDIVELVMEMENEFKIEIPDENIKDITSVKVAVEYIQNRLNHT